MLPEFEKYINSLKDLFRLAPDSDLAEFNVYLNNLLHRWMGVLYVVAVPTHLAFIYRDYLTVGPDLFDDFLNYRIWVIIPYVIILFIVKNYRPGRFTLLFGYYAVFSSALVVSQMTVQLGGFESNRYAGLNIIIIGVNLLLPWRYFHSLLNGIVVIVVYIVMNSLTPQHYRNEILINNIFYLSATVVVTGLISYFHLALIRSEFLLRHDLHIASDKLWSEMELAKKLQTSLLPGHKQIGNYEIASVMIPADEVGGDYYDIIEDENGGHWIAIGDVSGHGVESGLIMMMAQTAIVNSIQTMSSEPPARILAGVNRVLYKNINRLKNDRYMTVMLMKVENERIVFAGRHMDFFVYRAASGQVEKISKSGAYIGVFSDVEDDLTNHTLAIGSGDIILLFTDGVTEATNIDGEMFGEDKLAEIFGNNTSKTPEEIVKLVTDSVFGFTEIQNDDITVFVLRKL